MQVFFLSPLLGAGHIIFAGGYEQRVKQAIFQSHQLISESNMNTQDPEIVKHENL